MTGIIVVTRAAAQIPAEHPVADPSGLADSTEAISAAVSAAGQPDACTELNRAGQPCKGRPVRDGRCPAHKAR